jgi:hypothetical protein
LASTASGPTNLSVLVFGVTEMLVEVIAIGV